MPDFNIKRPRVTGQFNHAGDLAPLRSGYYDQLTATKGQAIAHPAYCAPMPKGVGGTMGALSSRSATSLAIVAATGYFGDTPKSLQGIVRATVPWNRR